MSHNAQLSRGNQTLVSVESFLASYAKTQQSTRRPSWPPSKTSPSNAGVRKPQSRDAHPSRPAVAPRQSVGRSEPRQSVGLASRHNAAPPAKQRANQAPPRAPPPTRVPPLIALRKHIVDRKNQAYPTAFHEMNHSRMDVGQMVEYYHKMEVNGLRDVIGAINLIEIANDVSIKTVVPGTINVYEIKQLRAAYAALVDTAIWRLKCALINMDNAVEARRYTSHVFHWCDSDSGHEYAISMLRNELIGIDRYISKIEDMRDIIGDIHQDKPVIGHYVFIDSRLVKNKTCLPAVPEKCVLKLVST